MAKKTASKDNSGIEIIESAEALQVEIKQGRRLF
jgi:hypothetical protein